jgi:2-polyprenyl-6-methoxyphenol hydroxylase-like FAD-dependent oxidoreductase
VDQTLTRVNELSNAYPLHLGQNKLNEYLYNKLPDKNNFLFGHETQNFNFDQKEQKYTITSLQNNSNIHTIKSKYLIGCDGSHSIVRKKLKIENKGTKGIQSFVNAHFTSKDLARKLKSLNKQSMLHFIFNPKFVCVLISYDLDKGEFVMQIPFFYKVEKESDYTDLECKRIIKELLSSDYKEREMIKIVNFYFFNFLNIEDVKFWRMKNVVIDKWVDNNCFIIGDAAHQFPPSGGYGLNTGVSDAFSLAWRIKYLLKHEHNSQNENLLKNSFEQERIIHSNVKKLKNLIFSKNFIF